MSEYLAEFNDRTITLHPAPLIFYAFTDQNHYIAIPLIYNERLNNFPS